MDNGYELAHSSGVAKMPEQSHYSQRGSVDRDEADLIRLGKKPVLKVSARLDIVQDIKTEPVFVAQVRFHVIVGL